MEFASTRSSFFLSAEDCPAIDIDDLVGVAPSNLFEGAHFVATGFMHDKKFWIRSDAAHSDVGVEIVNAGV